MLSLASLPYLRSQGYDSNNAVICCPHCNESNPTTKPVHSDEDIGGASEAQADIGDVKGDDIYTLTFQNEYEHHWPPAEIPAREYQI